MIRSKIDARERALELAVTSLQGCTGIRTSDIVDTAISFKNFIIGDAELPEVFDENTPLKEFIEFAKKGMDDANKRNDDLFGDIIKTLPEDVIRDKGLVGIIPCKSEAEWSMSDKVNWEQAKVDAAISVMQGIIANPADYKIRCNEYSKEQKYSAYDIARLAVSYADSLIAELQRVKSKEE